MAEADGLQKSGFAAGIGAGDDADGVRGVLDIARHGRLALQQQEGIEQLAELRAGSVVGGRSCVELGQAHFEPLAHGQRAEPQRRNVKLEIEQQLRCTLLEILYARRRAEPGSPSFSNFELSELTGQPREHLEFTIWYLGQKKYVTRDDQSRLTITADGVDYVEQNRDTNLKRRLPATSES